MYLIKCIHCEQFTEGYRRTLDDRIKYSTHCVHCGKRLHGFIEGKRFKRNPSFGRPTYIYHIKGSKLEVVELKKPIRKKDKRKLKARHHTGRAINRPGGQVIKSKNAEKLLNASKPGFKGRADY
jgi:hypothetical protein